MPVGSVPSVAAGIVVALLAVAVLILTALYVAPRLQSSTRVEFGPRALTVLALGLLLAGVLTVVAIALRLVSG